MHDFGFLRKLIYLEGLRVVNTVDHEILLDSFTGWEWVALFHIGSIPSFGNSSR